MSCITPDLAMNGAGQATSASDLWRVSNDEIFISGLYGGHLGIAGNGGCRRSATRDGAARTAARRHPQPVVVGTTEQPAATADARGLPHWADGRSARSVATEPVGSGPPGTGDRSGAQQLYGATLELYGATLAAARLRWRSISGKGAWS